MNIQKYVYPEWKKGISTSELPDEIAKKYKMAGKSMAEFLDRQMMRELPDKWFPGWVRYHFPLNTDHREIELHNIIASQFSEFINNNLKAEDFTVQEQDMQRIENLHQSLSDEHKTKEQWFQEIRNEVNQIREAKYDPEKRKNRKKSAVSAEIVEENPPQLDESKQQPSAEILDRDFVYAKWMEEVNQKEISKSYWHIHEYMARFILDFAEEHTLDGRVTRDVVEDFLVEYGRGKRPKTMNHYNRVARYFWDFYDTLEKEEGLR